MHASRTRMVTTGALATVALIAAALLMQRGGRAAAPEGAQGAPPPVNVLTTTPSRRDVWRTLTLSGDVLALKEATLYAKTSGYLKEIFVDKGDRVRRGQLLAVLDVPETRSDALQYEESYQGALASLQGSEAARGKAQEQERESAADTRRADLHLEEARRSLARSETAIRSAQMAQAQSRFEQTPYRSTLAKAEQDMKRTEATQRECAAELRSARAMLEQARAQLRLATLTYDRYRKVQQQDAGLIAGQIVDEAEARLEEQKGKASAAEAKVEALNNRNDAARSEVASAGHQIEYAKAQLEAATGRMELAGSQVELSRADRSLMEGKVATAHQQVEVARSREKGMAQQTHVSAAQVKAQRAGAGAAMRARQRASAVSEFARITAPFDGIVTGRFVDPGALIQMAVTSPQARPVVQVMDAASVRMHAYVPERFTPEIRRRQMVEVAVEALPGRPFGGSVTRISGALDPKTRTMLTEVVIPNQDGKLLPGMYARMRFKLEKHAHALTVPAESILTEKSGKSVFTVVAGKAKKIPVKTGFEEGPWVEILEGLGGDEQVVVTGRDQVVAEASVIAKPWTQPVQ